MARATHRRRVKAGVRTIAVGAPPPNKNMAHAESALSAPGDFHSIGISLYKLLEPEARSLGDGVEDDQLFVDWRQELEAHAPSGGDCLDHDYVTMSEGKLPRDMAKEEIQQNWQDFKQAKVKEINGLYDSGCSQRHPRHKSHDIIDARWVVIWKMIEGNVGVNCRFALRGFKYKFQDLDNYAGTSCRSSQRFVNDVAAENEDFILFSFDVGQACAKGLTFESLVS